METLDRNATKSCIFFVVFLRNLRGVCFGWCVSHRQTAFLCFCVYYELSYKWPLHRRLSTAIKFVLQDRKTFPISTWCVLYSVRGLSRVFSRKDVLKNGQKMERMPWRYFRTRSVVRNIDLELHSRCCLFDCHHIFDSIGINFCGYNYRKLQSPRFGCHRMSFTV